MAKRKRKIDQINVRCDRELMRAIDQEAERQERNRSQVVILAVREYLRTRQGTSEGRAA